MALQAQSQTLAGNVITSLRSSSTITTHTLECLKGLLGLEAEGHGIKVAPRRPQVTKKPFDATSRSKSGTRNTERDAAKKQDFEIYEASECAISPLPPAKRRKLATESFNITLKHLTTAAKEKRAEPTSLPSISEKASPRKQAKSTQPLQPCSANRRAKNVSTVCEDLVQEDKNVLVAECAGIALDYLHSLNTDNQIQKSGGDLQQERGGLVLLDKLISLDLAKHASLQVTKIYEQYWKRRKSIENNQVRSKSTFRISDYIATDLAHDKEQDLSFLASLQGQLLRLVILLGPVTITQEFVESIAFQNSNSPASLVLRSRNANFLDDEKAGLQLRTISLASFKLYSKAIALKGVQSQCPQVILDLLVQSLVIKCRSWTYLKHSPELNRELWAHLLQGMKRLEKVKALDQALLYQKLKSHFETLYSALSENKFDPTPSSEVVLFLSELGAQSGHAAESLRLLDVCTKSSSQNIGVTSLVPRWHRAVTAFKASCKRDDCMLVYFKEALDTLQCTTRLDEKSLEDLLVHSSRLRKACSAIIAEIEASTRKVCSSIVEIKLQTCCIQILIGLVAFLPKQVLSCLSSSPSVTVSHQQRYRSILMGLAKSVESVLDLENQTLVKEANLQDEYQEAVAQCIKLSQDMQEKLSILSQEDALSDVIKSFPVRISNLFWTRYMHSLEANSIQPEPLEHLSHSIAVVQPYDTCIQRTALLGMKLEKFAVANLQAKNVGIARQAFEDAIVHYIQIGAAADVVEAALSGPSSKVWLSSGSKSYVLGKALGSHGKLTLNYDMCSTGSGTWLYDDESLPSIHRCVLLEKQLLECIDQPITTVHHRNASIACIQQVLMLCVEAKYAIYRSRFVLNLLKASANHNSSLVREALEDETVCESMKDEASEFLQEFALSTRCCLGIEWGFCTSKPSPTQVLQHVKTLRSHLSNLHSISALERSVNDVEFCFNQLRTVLSYARYLDDDSLIMETLLAIRSMIIIRYGPTHSSLLPYLTQIGSLQSRIGRLSEAGLTFVSGQEILDIHVEPCHAQIQWTLAYIDHLMAMNDISGVEKMLQKAHKTFVVAYTTLDSISSRQRLERDALLSRAARISSQLAHQNGDTARANQNAKQAFKISAAIWRAIEPQHVPAHDSSSLVLNDSTLNILSAEMSNLALTSEQQSPQWQTRGAAFWDFAGIHYEALSCLIWTSLHNGLYQDALQYGKMLEKVAESIGSSKWKLHATSFLALVYAKAGQKQDASNMLNGICFNTSDVVDVTEAEFCILRVEALLELGNFERATCLLSCVEKYFSIQEKADTLQPPSNKATTKKGRLPVRSLPKAVRPIKQSAKHPAQRNTPALDLTQAEHDIRTMCLRHRSLRDRVLTMQNKLDLAASKQSDELLPCSEVALTSILHQSSDCRITNGMIMLQNALHELSSDPVKCVLTETAIALPVRYMSTNKNGRVSFVQLNNSPATVKARKPARSRATSKSELITIQPVTAGEQLLATAQKSLQTMSSGQLSSCSSEMLHLAGRLQSKLALLSSTTKGPLNTSSIQLFFQSMSPKDIIQLREKLTIKAELATSEKDQVLVWPETLCEPSERQAFDTQNKGYDPKMLDDIPESWSIISLSLAEDQQEMLVSRVVARMSPFVLRIPLSRPDMEAEGEDEFSFQEAMSELREIITEANASCHDQRGQGNKETRLKWYAERQALDKRLEVLLRNIQNIWLGGFRGLMNACKIDDQILAKFGQTLSQILDQHLPSRQKSGNSSTAKVELHIHVFELFIGLGNPDEEEMDDAITDLLYFVVDILQFSGERNAYDEIDFDAMLVEVLDALRASHELVQQKQDLAPGHIILIVDKELASIPWESLPCMQGHAISRMPSMSAIMERLTKVQEQAKSVHGYSLSTAKGAYMLNPSSDLVSTQSVFEPILRTHLPEFASTIKKPPTESDFEETLRNNDLFLYFGHGAGAQYIRGRKIRSLDKCAVTLLMGCSSAKMNECGKFESYGMPGYYIGGLSSCMAVVGTLWDVTDRDIDRFALKLMVEWGLVPEDELVSQALEKPRKKGQPVKANNKGKANFVGVEARRGEVGLDEAVCRGRDACALKYLNGAAPVVYGIPVYLG